MNCQVQVQVELELEKWTWTWSELSACADLEGFGRPPPLEKLKLLKKILDPRKVSKTSLASCTCMQCAFQGMLIHSFIYFSGFIVWMESVWKCFWRMFFFKSALKCNVCMYIKSFLFFSVLRNAESDIFYI